MKVSELIKLLSSFDQDAVVLRCDNEISFLSDLDCKEIEQINVELDYTKAGSFNGPHIESKDGKTKAIVIY